MHLFNPSERGGTSTEKEVLEGGGRELLTKHREIERKDTEREKEKMNRNKREKESKSGLCRSERNKERKGEI